VLKAMSYDGGVKELVEEIEKEFISITNSHDRKGLILAKDVLERTLADLEQRLANEGTLTGVPSGFKDLDRMTGGWQKSDLILIGARPGMGKTAFALNCALNAAREGKGVAVFTLEMADTQLMMRLLSAEGRVDSGKLRKGDLDDEERDRLMLGARELYKLNLGIDETPGITILELRSRCRRFKKERGLDLIIIDYLQLMRGSVTKKYDSREHEISEVSRELKALAKELNVPIIALAQLNRGVEKRTDRTPQISDLRESGSIEQDADIILMLYRDEYYNKDSDSTGVALLKLAKNRHGSTDDVQLAFLPNFMKFADLYKAP
jgi:replicative DNA helicase